MARRAFMGALLAAIMTWDPSASLDATNCYHIVTQQRSPTQTSNPSAAYDYAYIKRYSTSVCGPPFAWTLPPDPPAGWLQYFCIQTRSTSNLYSVCAEIDFVK
ncbi:MAG TPA: hypothetical protein VFE84_00345 [Patescibacteria group bacterium]|jgi:hypothetical protein|nr:hypothetical protein [Patescibacteria group bacterium]